MRIHQASCDQQLICPAPELLPKPCAEEIFEHVVTLSQERLHGRLQSRRWIRPKHLSREQPKPLHQELRKASSELFKRLPSTRIDFNPLINKLNGLCDSYQLFDNEWENMEQGFQLLKEIVHKSHDFCTSGSTCTLEETIRNFGIHGLNPSLVCADKRIQQVNKIGRYWGLCVHMAKCSKKYHKLFKDLTLQILQPYQSVNSSISFVEGKHVPCFVHAEIQLITFYGLSSNAAARRPRVLGVSKSACYLCSLFVLIQGHYFITKTHGHLYDQWNVPDLTNYKPNQLADYRRVLSEMNERVKRDFAKQKRGGYSRKHPLTSTVDLPKGQTLSPLPSDVGTLISNGSSNPDYNLNLPPIRSLVLPNEQQDSSIPRAEPPMLNDELITAPKHSSTPLLQPKLARASSTRSKTSTPLNESPTTSSNTGRPPQFPTTAQSLQPSSHGPETSTPLAQFLKKSAQPMASPKRSSSPSVAPKSSSSSSNDSDPSTSSPTFQKKSAHARISSQHSSSPSTSPESSSSSSTSPYPLTPHVEPPSLNIQPTTSHPSSPPSNPNSTHSILTRQSAESVVTASHTRLSNSPVSSSTEKSRLLSSTSIASRQLPVLKDISRDSPIRVSAGKMSTEIEFRGPGQGKVLVQNIENPGITASGTFVDIEALLPNDSLLLERAETDDQLALILQYRRRSLRLDIRWH